MLPTYSPEQLKKYRDDKEIVELTCKQVIKDFALFGLPLDFPENMEYAYPIMYNQLCEQIQELLYTNNMKLLSVLYQIDLSEAKIQKRVHLRPDVAAHEIITELILERELQKVLMRLYFSKHMG